MRGEDLRERREKKENRVCIPQLSCEEAEVAVAALLRRGSRPTAWREAPRPLHPSASGPVAGKWPAGSRRHHDDHAAQLPPLPHHVTGMSRDRAGLPEGPSGGAKEGRTPNQTGWGRRTNGVLESLGTWRLGGAALSSLHFPPSWLGLWGGSLPLGDLGVLLLFPAFLFWG